MREPRYSGPNRSGICICGCPVKDHHLSCVMRQEYVDETGEQYIPGECVHFGSNESGGLKYNKQKDEWEDHCHGYKDTLE